MIIMMVNRDSLYYIQYSAKGIVNHSLHMKTLRLQAQMNFLVPQAVGFQPKLPVLGPPSQYLFCFLPHPSNTFCSNEERAELWLRLWKSAPEKGGRKEEKRESFFKPWSHTYPLLYLLCWEAEPNTFTKTKTHFLLTLGLRVKNRHSYSPIIYAK